MPGGRKPDRRRRNRVVLTYRGETRSLTEWAEVTGVRFGELRRRINVLGWSVAKALSTPDDRGDITRRR